MQRGRRHSARDIALEAIRVCGYRGDRRTATRILVEHRISRREHDEHFNLGATQRAESTRTIE